MIERLKYGILFTNTIRGKGGCMSLFRHVLVILMVCAFIASCVTINGQDPAAQKAEEYKQLFDPMLGVATKSDIRTRFGEPLRKDHGENAERWHYRKHFGAYKTGSSEPRDDRLSQPGNSDIWEVFDELNFEFDGIGILRKWEVNVQR